MSILVRFDYLAVDVMKLTWGEHRYFTYRQASLPSDRCPVTLALSGVLAQEAFY